jgi:anti-sigma B factor antagonist
MSYRRELHLALESKLSSVDAAELIVQQLALQGGLDQEQIEHLGIAVRESMVNAVTHGNAYSKNKSGRFGVTMGEGRLTVTVEDEGCGFNPDDVPDPLAEGNLLRISGRGLLLMRSFFDNVEITRQQDDGTRVVMVKNYSEGPGNKEEQVRLNASIRNVSGVSIVDLSGRITIGEGSGKLRDTIREILSQGQKKILLNLADVSYIDSSGLGELVSSYTTASNQGAKLKLVKVQAKVNDLLQITKLYTVFETFEDESKATMSFS